MAAVAPPPSSMNAPPSNISRPSSVASKREKSIPAAAAAASSSTSGDKSLAPSVKVEGEAVAGEDRERSPPNNAGGASKEGSPTNPTRPAIRPVAASRSKFDLEPNPFEQSFRQSQTSVSSASDHAEKTPPRGGDATSIKHNALPPLSSLTSPAAADPSQFPWLASQSLRAGPLSPAMLQGPQNAAAAPANGASRNPSGSEPTANGEGGFDSSTFRTGFTPGAGTGFTPGYTSLINAGNFGSLPMPSPNTAAFLNMVTNGTPIGEGGEGGAALGAEGQQPAGQTLQPPSALPPHMQQQAGHPPHGLQHVRGPDVPGTITPNTLSALTGVANEMARSGSNPVPPPQPGMYYPPPMHGQMPPPMPPNVDYAQQSANAASQAANGLFLLSQAHHELSKREQEVDPRTQRMPSHGAQPPTVKPGAGTAGSGAGPAATGQKRKSDPGAAGKPAAKKGKKGGAGANAGAGPGPNAFAKDESTSPKFSMDGDSDDGEMGSRSDNKAETEEDKRKNFLERNRQAALKCRQRKKAWLGELQSKVEILTQDNERLQATVHGLHEEVNRLNSILMQHRDCGLGLPVPYGRPLR